MPAVRGEAVGLVRLGLRMIKMNQKRKRISAGLTEILFLVVLIFSVVKCEVVGADWRELSISLKLII